VNVATTGGLQDQAVSVAKVLLCFERVDGFPDLRATLVNDLPGCDCGGHGVVVTTSKQYHFLASNGNSYQDLAHVVHSLLTVTGSGALFFVRRELRSSCAAFLTDLT